MFFFHHLHLRLRVAELELELDQVDREIRHKNLGGFLVDMVIFVSKPVFCLVCLCSKYNGTFGCQSKVWWNFVCCVS